MYEPYVKEMLHYQQKFLKKRDNNGLLLPINTSLTGVKDLFNLLSNMSQQLKTQSLMQQSHLYLQSLKEEPQFKNNDFITKLINHFQVILRYEDKNLQNKVKLILPLEKLQITAMEKLHKIQKEMKIKNIDGNVVFEDVLFGELLSWFKFKFFKWVDSPVCKKCRGECSFDHIKASPDPQISRIEIHKCKNCRCENEFPRYIDPEPLLYTRQGRCGEWANCFTLICRTVGFDSRLVYDQTDHIWTEVWSIAENRWIHADVCENIIDRPLMYEKGWGKKLSYIIAFSKDEMQDVTWRYTNDFEKVMQRRNLCSEETLVLFINKLNLVHQSSNNYSSARRKFVVKRSALELASMINAPLDHKKCSKASENDSDYVGRVSGSQAWRISRGEMGNVSYEPTHWKIPQQVSDFELTYSIINDCYATRDVINNRILETKQKWQNGVEYVNGGVFLKKEEDWKMVYLARSPESITGTVTWSFVVENYEKMTIDSVELQATTATFNEAVVEWRIQGIFDRDSLIIKEAKITTGNFRSTDFCGAIRLKVSATLRGGKGDTAWQHAQLFRQSLSTNSKKPCMVIKITLENAKI
ncbi:PREDICTED: peptide-N(4)-(N-acetyl-beta-glucosaminyl)asparagine amidase [Ceratosolen solmsi marchali]|uniref:Peptide-N(4)-(N-acetyl-beta-glucosaminyl)asparagine amidase n=1 Tax=Ceratosolen solmsi marchali TaxID=326594 RepID=A0AAJ6VLD5_9HYME|nr:PREDICTED: peptide-N(4)-(N-acetyl-beta-glucosaminyl)asparagine amidase [Ceratosolen solmsi marchali]